LISPANKLAHALSSLQIARCTSEPVWHAPDSAAAAHFFGVAPLLQMPTEIPASAIRINTLDARRQNSPYTPYTPQNRRDRDQPQPSLGLFALIAVRLDRRNE
jgi:hypothetical protein